jgi:hypothetical protein
MGDGNGTVIKDAAGCYLVLPDKGVHAETAHRGLNGEA